MAERRMFTEKITESDAFLEMPLSSQALYFHLCMNGDDDGFVKNPRRIAKMLGATDDDMKLLVAKNFVLLYENGVIVIKHWRMHNLLRKDRYHPTEYVEEKSMLYLKDNGAYTLDETQGKPLINGEKDSLATRWQPDGNHLATEDRLGKDSIVKYNNNNINNNKINVSKCSTLSVESDLEKIPLCDGTEWKPSEEEYQEYSRLFPDVNIETEFRKMRSWCNANTKKTRRGIKRFVNAWLSRAQDNIKSRSTKPLEERFKAIERWAESE